MLWLRTNEEVDGVVSVGERDRGCIEHLLDGQIFGRSLAKRSVAVAEEENIERNVEDEESAARNDQHHRR